MRIFIGNCFSFAASVFMSLAAYTDGKRRMLIYQTVDCFLLAIAQVIFGVTSGAAVLMLAALRNILMLKGKFGFGMMLIFLAAAVTLGTLTNNSGLLGFIPIIATLVLTVGLYAADSARGTKLVVFLNLLIWSVYSFVISDFATGVSNGASALICLVTLIAPARERKSGESAESAERQEKNGTPNDA